MGHDCKLWQTSRFVFARVGVRPEDCVPEPGGEATGSTLCRPSPGAILSLIKNLPFEWLVGIRYTRAGKRSGRNSFISFISLISMAGIALGVAALIVVLSVMNGFQKEVRDRMLSVLAHIEVFDASGSMKDWQAVAKHRVG